MHALSARRGKISVLPRPKSVDAVDVFEGRAAAYFVPDRLESRRRIAVVTSAEHLQETIALDVEGGRILSTRASEEMTDAEQSGEFRDEIGDVAKQRDGDRLLLGGEGSPGRRQPVGNQSALGGQELLTAFGEREDASASIVVGRNAMQQPGRLQRGRLLGYGSRRWWAW